MSEKQKNKRSTTRKPYHKPEVVKILLGARDMVLGCGKTQTPEDPCLDPALS
jgi:hypothetical protein